MYKTQQRRIFFVLNILVLRALLDLSYVVFIHPVFSYAGFNLDVNGLNYLFSWCFLFIAVVATPRLLNTISDLFVVLGVLFIIVPMSSLHGLAGRSFSGVLVCTLSIWSAHWIATRFSLSTIKLPQIRFGEAAAVCISVVGLMIVVAWFFASGAIRYFNLNLSAVYQFREISTSTFQVGIFAYLSNWGFKVFSIFIMVWTLLRANYFLFGLAVLLQVFFFGVSSYKSVLFMPIMVFGIWRFFRNQKSMLILPIAINVFVILSLLLFYAFDNLLLASISIRRMFFVVANFNFHYQTFFSENPYVLWSNSLLSPFFDYPYGPTNVGRLIGGHFGSGEYANSGYISSGYANAGPFGVAIYTVLVGFMLRQIEAMINDKSQHWFVVALVIVPIFSLLTASDLLVVLMTHGLIVTIFLIALLNSSRKKFFLPRIKTYEAV